MQKGLKKLLSIFLLLCMLISIFTACGKSSEPSSSDQDKETEQSTDKEQGEELVEEEEEIKMDLGGRVIKFSAWWDLTLVEGQFEHTDQVIARIAEMEEKYNFKFEYVNVPYDQYLETYTASSLAGDPFADLTYVASVWWYPTLVVPGFLTPLSDLGVFDFNEDKWDQTIISMATYKGKVYGVGEGRFYPANGVWWNKTIFEREGLPNLYELQKTNQWTWDKMLEIAKKATKDLDGDGVIDQWGLEGIDDAAYAFVYSNGGEFVRMGEDGRPIFALGEPKALEALQFYQDLINVHKVFEFPPDGAAWDYPVQQFQDGKAAMLIFDFWKSEDFQSNMQDDYGFALFPIGPQGEGYVSIATATNMVCIPAATKNPQDVAVIYDERTDPFPEDLADPDKRWDRWNEGYLNNLRDVESLETILRIQDENLTRFTLHRNFRELEVMSWSFMRQISSGNQTPAVAINEVAQQAQAILDDAVGE